MSPLTYSEKRLEAVLSQIDRLKCIEFPYEDSRSLLLEIEKEFRDHLGDLNQLTPENSREVINGACSAALYAISLYLPFLGFVLRSTNVRNGFEVYGPLLRLTRKVLDKEKKLVISSEWVAYSPFTYRIPRHKDFVLIGLPAPESANPLLLPLSGHELGHHVWMDHAYDKHFASLLDDGVVREIIRRWAEYSALFPDVSKEQIRNNDIVAQRTWILSSDWASKQAEESFCDIVGLLLYGESYFHAFAYLLSPKLSGSRSPHYPNFRRRVKDLMANATYFGISTPPKYEDMFDDQLEPYKEPGLSFMLSVADEASSKIMGDLRKVADDAVGDVSCLRLEQDESARCYEALCRAVPASNSGGLTNILNAAWKLFHDFSVWGSLPSKRRKESLLKDLVLKSIEVLEIEERLKRQL